MPDGEHLLLSSGWYGQSRISIIKFDFDTCSFKTIFSENNEPNYFAEGLTRVGDKVY